LKKAVHTQSEIANVIDRSVSTISRVKGGIRADSQGGAENRRGGDRSNPLLKPHRRWGHTITSDNGREFAGHEETAKNWMRTSISPTLTRFMETRDE